jgi:hypothetical protein
MMPTCGARAGFSPSPTTRSDTGMRFGLALERDGWRSVGVELTPAPGGVRGRVVLADGSPAQEETTDAACGQVARMLSLDVDGEGFPVIGERDAVAGRLQSRYPGLRPVLFGSPYDAAAWAIIGRPTFARAWRRSSARPCRLARRRSPCSRSRAAWPGSKRRGAA